MLAASLILSAALAACGGGGGGGGTSGGGGGGNIPSVPTPTPTPTAAPTPTPGAAGALTVNGGAVVKAVYTCGCSAQAGLMSPDASGNVTILSSTTAIPASPQPTYTAVPGRNYLVIGYAANHAQVWTMEFLGKATATNLNLAGNSTGYSTDTAATAAALYLYYDAGVRFSASSDQSFDQYNFNQIVAFANALRSSSANSAEKKLLGDVAAAQAAGQSMYPSGVPVWNPDAGVTANVTITNDLRAVASSGDAAIPTPCPASGCTNAPTP